MVSCRLVEAAAAVAATLTGLLLSNWWIILLLIWPPKAGNARLLLTVYKLLLCYYTLQKKKYIQLLFTEELVQSTLNTIYRSCSSRMNLLKLLCHNVVDLSHSRSLPQIWESMNDSISEERSNRWEKNELCHSVNSFNMPMCNWLCISCPPVLLPIWSILSLP